MMKAMGGGKRGPMGKMAQMFGLGGGNPLSGMPQPTPEQIEAMQRQMGGQLPPNMPKLPDAPPSGAFGPKPGMPGLPGAMPKLPGLGSGGFNPFQFGKKK
jgi:signal recognition particle subunit SRP54